MVVYVQERSVLLRSSASALCNNLDILEEGPNVVGIHVAVVHKSSVNVVTISDDDRQSRQITCKGPPGYKKLVLQAKWCKLKDFIILVIAFQQGIQIWQKTGFFDLPKNHEGEICMVGSKSLSSQVLDWDGSVLLYWYQFSEPETGTFSRGIASLGNHCIGVGTHTGQVLIFRVGPKGSEVTQEGMITTGRSPITALASSDRWLACAADDGALTIWHSQPPQPLQQPFHKLRSFDGYGFPCSNLVLWKDMLLAGYGSGHLRLFSLVSGRLLVEANAHARWITGLDIAPHSGLVLSTSEDSFVRVWRLYQDKQILEHLCSIHVADAQLCGGSFVDPQGKSFVVTGYELEELLIFRAKS